jgi:hypothetical protein
VQLLHRVRPLRRCGRGDGEYADHQRRESGEPVQSTSHRITSSQVDSLNGQHTWGMLSRELADEEEAMARVLYVAAADKVVAT